MIKIYQKQPIRAEQFNGTSDSANRLGVEWEDGNGFIGDPSYTPESQPCWYIPEDKFTVFGYDENSIKPDDWIIECSGNIRLIMINNEFKKTYAELPVIPKAVADWIELGKSKGASFDTALLLTLCENKKTDGNELARWIMHGNLATVARAWLDGYQVEEDE
ncbi:DUF1642 domain-containing protein [Levilactobacillus brevis]|uniref:DUF1642 domain-containing protein n=1 Tax=Levilactobacillus brevis TaxID=1580 RepID=UPI003F63EE84